MSGEDDNVGRRVVGSTIVTSLAQIATMLGAISPRNARSRQVAVRGNGSRRAVVRRDSCSATNARFCIQALVVEVAHNAALMGSPATS